MMAIKRLLVVIVLLMLSVIMYFGRDILMPITLGILISLTLTPPVRFLIRKKIPAGLAALLIVFSVGAFIGLGARFLTEPITELMQTLPDVKAQLERQWLQYEPSVKALSEVSDQVSNIASDKDDETMTVVIDQPGLITSAASSVANGLTTLMLALLLALFTLASGDLLQQKLVAVMPVLSEKKKALRIMRDVEGNVSRYLLTITIINGLLGVAVGLSLHLYGMPGAALWGAIAAAFNFIPFLGAVAGAGLLGAISLGTFDTFSAALIPPAIYMSLSLIEGNIITPLTVGRSLKLNVVAVFLTVVFWAWLWGVPGALMAVPILVVVKVFCDHVEGWTTLGEFLSARSPRLNTHPDLD